MVMARLPEVEVSSAVEGYGLSNWWCIMRLSDALGTWEGGNKNMGHSN